VEGIEELLHIGDGRERESDDGRRRVGVIECERHQGDSSAVGSVAPALVATSGGGGGGAGGGEGLGQLYAVAGRPR